MSTEHIPNLELIEAGNERAKFRSPDGEGYFEYEIVYKDSNDETLDHNKVNLLITGENVLSEPLSEIVSFSHDVFNTAKKESGEINPTKVFWLVAKALEKLVCPNCSDGIN